MLQHYEDSEAPQIPFGYPTMPMMTLVPPLWFRVMNPRVDAWRAHHTGRRPRPDAKMGGAVLRIRLEYRRVVRHSFAI
ncbi:MAG: hypothetical protein HC850_13470 [Rhodomicrobium sp.]|nr:hypothetical protein [Rhodomicrobium sp.]